MVFIPVVGWEGFYQVNENGDVESIDRLIVRRDGTKQKFKGVSLKRFFNDAGYCLVRLSDDSNGRRLSARVHRLVAEAFIPNPLGKKEVNHIDGDKSNPQLSNLEWCTSRENRKHAWDTGLRNKNHLPSHKGEQQGNAKLNNKIVFEIIELRASGYSYGFLAKKFGVSKRTIGRIVSGESWRHLTLPSAPKVKP